MLKRAAITLFCCVLLILSSFAQTPFAKQKKNTAPTLFTINKKAISADEFIYLFKKNHQEQDFKKEKIDEYLELFINFKLKVEEAKERGLDTTQVFLKEYNGYTEELRKPYLPDAKIVDSLVSLTYARMQEEINASHILIAIKSDASPADTLKAFNTITALRNRVLGGEDFGQVAATFSEDPSAKQNKGSLGYFTALQMVYPFETTAYATKTGNVSHPVRTRFGYHILKVFDRRPARGEVEVSHIMIRTGNTNENENVKNTIFNIHDQVQAGVSWDELCKQHSEDPSTKENGGKLRPFGAGAMSAIPEFERIAFQLQKPGEISDPFQTQYGWHIMRLERKIPVPPFDEVAASLKTRVTRDERTELSKKDLQNKLRKDYQFSENHAAKTKLISHADINLQKGKWDLSGVSMSEKETLFTLKDKKISVKDFVDFVKKNQQTSSLSPEKYFDQLYNQFVDAIIIKRVEERIIRDHPEYRFLLQEYYEGILLFDIMEKEVWSKASQDSVGQQAYYAENKKDYTTTERAQVTLYSSNTRDFREPLRKLILDSAWTKAESFVAEHKVKTETGYFKKDESVILKQMPWVKGVYPAENKGIYYLAWLKDILPPGYMSFEEARPSIISDYQAFLEKNWVTTLKKKYSIKVNGKGKQYIWKQLQGKG
jgi:peptidyl-prolyl cis-trans isomerase SurA